MRKFTLLVHKKVHLLLSLRANQDFLKKAGLNLVNNLSALFATLRKERVFWLIGTIASLVFLGALGFAFQEFEAPSFWVDLGNGLWWAVVTLTTVGYGDLVPKSVTGRLIGVGLMLSGLVILSLLTATVASVFIERKFRRERGLEDIRVNNHIIIMGWHRGGERILRDLLNRLEQRNPVVLISEMSPEEFEDIKIKFRDHDLFFLRGDFAREDLLVKANLRRAHKVLILADRMQERPREQIDQHTLLAALAVKAVNPKINISAELLYPENRLHLERAHVENIITRGEYDSALIASATTSAGLFKVLESLLSADKPNFWVVEIPARFHGLSVQEFSDYLRSRYQALLIGLFNEGQMLRLEDLLSGEASAIDEFIRRKFADAGMTHLFGRRRTECVINPAADHLIAPNEVAVVIANEQPWLSKGTGSFEQL